jgi:uncharacterized protein with HEPN domain
MPPEKTDFKYVWDMLDAAKTVIELTAGVTLEGYERDKHKRLAVERCVEIIGEAARRVSAEFRIAHGAVAWSAIIATRHILAHEYGDVQHDKVWRIATQHVPVLITQLQAILADEPPGKAPA